MYIIFIILIHRINQVFLINIFKYSVVLHIHVNICTCGVMVHNSRTTDKVVVYYCAGGRLLSGLCTSGTMTGLST